MLRGIRNAQGKCGCKRLLRGFVNIKKSDIKKFDVGGSRVDSGHYKFFLPPLKLVNKSLQVLGLSGFRYGCYSCDMWVHMCPHKICWYSQVNGHS